MPRPPNVLLSFLASELRRDGDGDTGCDGDTGDNGDRGCVGELAVLPVFFLVARGGGMDTISGAIGGDGDSDSDSDSDGLGAARRALCLALPEYTDGVSASVSLVLSDTSFVLTASSAYSSRSVMVDEVGAPESRFHSSPCDRGVSRGVRKMGCWSWGGGAKSGGMMTMGDETGEDGNLGEARPVVVVVVVAVVVDEDEVAVEAAVDVVRVDGVRVMRRGFRGGGRGIGGSACLVCSYRSATRLVSSRKGVRRTAAVGLPRWRTLPNF
jgi:hypothetical protein